MRFEKFYKLSLKYVGPLEIPNTIGEIAYQLV